MPYFVPSHDESKHRKGLKFYYGTEFQSNKKIVKLFRLQKSIDEFNTIIFHQKHRHYTHQALKTAIQPNNHNIHYKTQKRIL